MRLSAVRVKEELSATWPRGPPGPLQRGDVGGKRHTASRRVHIEEYDTSTFSEWMDFNGDVIRNRIRPSDVEFTSLITQPPCNAYGSGYN
ncbi:hypothetical protein EYF80_017057 [Liparis tanakae]|uniref:Uncharacterized protein n=1 Tax=Liparis tanakae TaxID=230148 RepID=A0A4Z2I6B8_9TELE|nr:hypothetical protein EYF80_017057 [Liparis tanakae]